MYKFLLVIAITLTFPLFAENRPRLFLQVINNSPVSPEVFRPNQFDQIKQIMRQKIESSYPNFMRTSAIGELFRPINESVSVIAINEFISPLAYGEPKKDYYAYANGYEEVLKVPVAGYGRFVLLHSNSYVGTIYGHPEVASMQLLLLNERDGIKSVLTEYPLELSEQLIRSQPKEFPGYGSRKNKPLKIIDTLIKNNWLRESLLPYVVAATEADSLFLMLRVRGLSTMSKPEQFIDEAIATQAELKARLLNHQGSLHMHLGIRRWIRSCVKIFER